MVEKTNEMMFKQIVLFIEKHMFSRAKNYAKKVRFVGELLTRCESLVFRTNKKKCQFDLLLMKRLQLIFQGIGRFNAERIGGQRRPPSEAVNITFQLMPLRRCAYRAPKKNTFFISIKYHTARRAKWLIN